MHLFLDGAVASCCFATKSRNWFYLVQRLCGKPLKITEHEAKREGGMGSWYGRIKTNPLSIPVNQCGQTKFFP